MLFLSLMAVFPFPFISDKLAEHAQAQANSKMSLIHEKTQWRKTNFMK